MEKEQGVAAFFEASEMLEKPMEAFFEKVFVMAEDEKVRAATAAGQRQRQRRARVAEPLSQHYRKRASAQGDKHRTGRTYSHDCLD